MSGIVDALRRISGRGSKEPEQGPTSPRTNVWSSTFDPGTNPNMKKAGRDFYDNVDNPEAAKSTWEYHLESEKSTARDVKQAAFNAFDKDEKGVIDKADLKRMFAPERVESIMKLADKNKDGKLDYKEFCELMRASPCDD